jgi:hypothetical protein
MEDVSTSDVVREGSYRSALSPQHCLNGSSTGSTESSELRF